MHGGINTHSSHDTSVRLSVFVASVIYCDEQIQYYQRGHRRTMRIDRVRTKAPIIFSAFFFTAFFLYLWLRINPSFYVLEQNIAFQGTWRYFQDFFSYPGGMVDYCSAFLSVFFTYPVVGAAVITILLLLIAYASYQLLRLLFGPRRWYAVHLFPVALCGAIQSNYDHPLSVTIALMIALLLFVFYGYQRFRPAFIRVLLYLILAAGLYYGAGGAFLLFSLLCMLFETIVCRRWVAGFFYGAVAVVIPFLSINYLFLVSTHDAWLHLLPFGGLGYKIPVLPYLLYAFFPALVIMAPGGNLLTHLFHFWGTRTKAFISGVSLIAVTVVTLIYSFHNNDHAALKFCSMSLQSKWKDILNEAGANTSNSTPLTDFMTAQALFYRGLLPVDLFSFPHYFGADGIFLSEDEIADNKKLEAFSFAYRGELSFKLGLINSAQHWFYEALSTQGSSAGVLKRLCQIHALKGDFPAARICLSVLKTMPMQRKWALQFGSRIEDRSFMASDPELAGIQKSMPTADFLLADSRQPYHDCEEADPTAPQ